MIDATCYPLRNPQGQPLPYTTLEVFLMKQTLIEAFQAAIAAAQPATAIKTNLPSPPKGKTVVIGFGKAAATMARALEQLYDAPLSGVVVTRYGHVLEPCQRIRVLEASHPVPDHNGVMATQEILKAVHGLSEDDLVICLASGGGSALLCAPDGISLESKMRMTQSLLDSGASIQQINTVRKHLSLVKGGRLAQACAPARVLSLIVSDVVGDDLSSIASGPTVPDPSTFHQALEIFDHFRIDELSARSVLQNGAQSTTDTPKPGDAIFARVENRLIVTNALALEAAGRVLTQARIRARVFSDSIEGDARLAAQHHAQAAAKLEPMQAWLSGGETTVTVRGNGRGGRNLEFMLALALHNTGCYGLACDSDGIDGSSHGAGAVVTPDTLTRAAALGLDARAYLDNNDAHAFFERLDDLIVTGPTGTNVNDIRMVLRA
jgi:glycerate 2-kinase